MFPFPSISLQYTVSPFFQGANDIKQNVTLLVLQCLGHFFLAIEWTVTDFLLSVLHSNPRLAIGITSIKQIPSAIPLWTVSPVHLENSDMHTYVNVSDDGPFQFNSSGTIFNWHALKARADSQCASGDQESGSFQWFQQKITLSCGISELCETSTSFFLHGMEIRWSLKCFEGLQLVTFDAKPYFCDFFLLPSSLLKKEYFSS